jgi:hypothetical protein
MAYFLSKEPLGARAERGSHIVSGGARKKS